MSDQVAARLDRLYPGPSALRLIPLCSPIPYRHGGEPCSSPGKRPIEAGWVEAADRRSQQLESRTDHLEQIRAHLAGGGNVGLAIPCGVLALDADSDLSQSWLGDRLGEAPWQESGRGGHFLVAISGDLDLRSSTRRPLDEGVEVDLRAHRSQIVVEPSIHASTGRPYRWRRQLPGSWEELPVLPTEIAQSLVASTGAGPGAREGERNSYLARAGGRLRRRGMSAREIEAALLEKNAEFCEPPLDAAEVAAIASSMARYKPHAVADTDMANARRLVLQHGSDLRYCDKTNSWYVWDGCRWVRDETRIRHRFAKETVRQILVEAAEIEDDRARRRLASFGSKSQSDRAIRAMVELAKSEPEIAVALDQLDSMPGLLNVENGTIELGSPPVFRLHGREDLLTKLAPVTYVRGHRSDVWEEFLERTLPQPDLRRFAQKVVGYSLGGTADRDLVIVIHGPPRTGKGSFQGAIAAALGSDYVMTAGLSDLGQRRHQEAGPRPELVRLRGARIVNVYETSERLRLSASLLKSIAGGDPISARGLHQAPIEFKPQFVLWIASNHWPQVADDDEAVWERIRVIPFAVPVGAGERDPELRKTLRDDPEIRSAVLSWALEGLLMVQAEGLEVPETVWAATREYRREMDPLADFLAERCGLGPERRVPASLLRAAYEAWCQENGHQPISAKQMGPRLRAQGCERLKGSYGGKRRWLWIGIDLCPD